jgi:hypothetical protein
MFFGKNIYLDRKKKLFEYPAESLSYNCGGDIGMHENVTRMICCTTGSPAKLDKFPRFSRVLQTAELFFTQSKMAAAK